jgi:RNA polymerase sigma-70 factor (ECF subfamily)
MDVMTPDRHLTARDELRRVQAGLDRLPPRCREVVRLRKIEGLSTRETAERLGVGIDTVEQQTVHGMRALVDFMMGGSGKIQRGAARRTLAKPS